MIRYSFAGCCVYSFKVLYVCNDRSVKYQELFVCCICPSARPKDNFIKAFTCDIMLLKDTGKRYKVIFACRHFKLCNTVRECTKRHEETLVSLNRTRLDFSF